MIVVDTNVLVYAADADAPLHHECRNWLDRHYPNTVREAVSSNGEAARLAASTPGVAAVAGEIAAELYQLQALAEHIEDYPDNTTRFLVIGREARAISWAAMASEETSFSTNDTPRDFKYSFACRQYPQVGVV